MGTYRTAQVCKNGHVITSNIHNSAHLSNFCPECRAETITSCPNCNTPIRGEYDVPGVISFSTYTPPKYMQDQLTEEEKKHFMSYLPVIFSETPQSEVSALQLKLLFNKLPSEISSLAKRLISDAISEGIRNILFP